MSSLHPRCNPLEENLGETVTASGIGGWGWTTQFRFLILLGYFWQGQRSSFQGVDRDAAINKILNGPLTPDGPLTSLSLCPGSGDGFFTLVFPSSLMMGRACNGYLARSSLFGRYFGYFDDETHFFFTDKYKFLVKLLNLCLRRVKIQERVNLIWRIPEEQVKWQKAQMNGFLVPKLPLYRIFPF